MLKSLALALELSGPVDGAARQKLAVAVERDAAAVQPRRILRAVAALILAVGLSTLALAVPIDVDRIGDYGYLGVFLITLITTGAFVLPIPYLAVIFRAGTFLNPVAVALVAGLAAAGGELTGYLLGYSGRELVAGNRWRLAAERWMARYGFASIVFLSFIPNPFFDAAGIAAGALRYPAWRFALACFLGKTAKFLLVALGGALW